MRLFPGIFTTLAAQALLASAVSGGLLVALTFHGQTVQFAARDRDRLDAMVAVARDGARVGRPTEQIVRDLEMRRAQLADTLALTAGDRRYLLTQYLGIGVIIAGLFASLLVAAYIFARRWSRPQLELHRLSREVVNGDLDVEVDENAPPEVLATMRNLRRIASQFSRLETARRTWIVAIADELKRPTENMGEHFIRLCEAEPPLDRDLLAAIEQDTHRLIHMSEDLNAVALADLGRLPVTFDQVDPRALIHNAIYAHKHRAETQGVRLTTSKLPEYTILVKWDGGRIEQLFGALIDNSLRYTPPRGQIVLGLESSRDAWRLIIDDSAPGIDVMLAQRLFEPFYRSADRSNESAASGLGLATARAIVEAHHGRIEASRSPIGGLRVTVVLPANPPTA